MATNTTSTENAEELPGLNTAPPSPSPSPSPSPLPPQPWEETSKMDKEDKLSLLKYWLNVTCPEWLNNLDVCEAIKNADTMRSHWVDGIPPADTDIETEHIKESLLKEDIRRLEAGIAGRSWKIDVEGNAIRKDLDDLKAKKAKEVSDVMATRYHYPGLMGKELDAALQRINQEYDPAIKKLTKKRDDLWAKLLIEAVMHARLHQRMSSYAATAGFVGDELKEWVQSTLWGQYLSLSRGELLDAEKEVIAYLWKEFLEAHKGRDIDKTIMSAARQMMYGSGAEFVDFNVNIIPQEQREIQANYEADLALATAGVRDIAVVENIQGSDDFSDDDYVPDFEYEDCEDQEYLSDDNEGDESDASNEEESTGSDGEVFPEPEADTKIETKSNVENENEPEAKIKVGGDLVDKHLTEAGWEFIGHEASEHAATASEGPATASGVASLPMSLAEQIFHTKF